MKTAHEKTLKKFKKDLPFQHGLPAVPSALPRDMKNKQREWIPAGLKHLRAPIVVATIISLLFQDRGSGLVQSCPARGNLLWGHGSHQGGVAGESTCYPIRYKHWSGTDGHVVYDWVYEYPFPCLQFRSWQRLPDSTGLQQLGLLVKGINFAIETAPFRATW